MSINSEEYRNEVAVEVTKLKISMYIQKITRISRTECMMTLPGPVRRVRSTRYRACIAIKAAPASTSCLQNSIVFETVFKSRILTKIHAVFFSSQKISGMQFICIHLRKHLYNKVTCQNLLATVKTCKKIVIIMATC